MKGWNCMSVLLLIGILGLYPSETRAGSYEDPKWCSKNQSSFLCWAYETGKGISESTEMQQFCKAVQQASWIVANRTKDVWKQFQTDEKTAHLRSWWNRATLRLQVDLESLSKYTKATINQWKDNERMQVNLTRLQSVLHQAARKIGKQTYDQTRTLSLKVSDTLIQWLTRSQEYDECIEQIAHVYRCTSTCDDAFEELAICRLGQLE